MRALLLAAAVAALASPAFAQSLSLKGPTGQTATATAADIAALPRVKFVFDADGQRHEYEGPMLIDVLAKVDAPTGTALRGAALSNAILVKAADGYQVAFGLAEADPGTRANRMILADRADGQPLGKEDGPFKVVVEGDLRPARSARMVTAIEVITLGTPAPQKSHAH